MLELAKLGPVLAVVVTEGNGEEDEDLPLVVAVLLLGVDLVPQVLLLSIAFLVPPAVPLPAPAPGVGPGALLLWLILLWLRNRHEAV